MGNEQKIQTTKLKKALPPFMTALSYSPLPFLPIAYCPFAFYGTAFAFPWVQQISKQ
jgi:hypothetical protein